MESARAFGIREESGEEDDLGEGGPRGTLTLEPPLGTLRCGALRPRTLVVEVAADEPIDLDDTVVAAFVAAEEEIGSRPAITPRVATAVDLPAADADEDAAAVRAAPLASAADSFEVLLLCESSSSSLSSSSCWAEDVILLPGERLLLMVMVMVVVKK